MKTFKVFLEKTITDSEERKQRLSRENAMKFIKQHCTKNVEMIEQDRPLWRGFGDAFDDYALLDYSTSVRASQNMANINTLLFDNNPKNKQFPKRSESIICTSSHERGASYGNYRKDSIYALIPYNGVDVACVNQEDIWDTEIHGSRFNLMNEEGYAYANYGATIKKSLARIFKDCGVRLNPDFDKDINEFSKELKRAAIELRKNEHLIDSYRDVFKEQDCINWFCRIIVIEKSNNDAVNKMIEEMMIPMTGSFLGFSIQKSGIIDHDNSECWFSGPCIAISAIMWQVFRDDFLKGKF